MLYQSTIRIFRHSYILTAIYFTFENVCKHISGAADRN